MGVGVNYAVGVTHDRDMSLPEDQIAALQFLYLGRTQPPPEAILLHVAVARAAGAGGVQRYLDDAGAIDAERALATPEIGRADEAFGDRDEILFHRVEAADMPLWQIPAFACYGERAVFTGNRHARAHRQRLDRWQLDRRSRKRKGPQRRDLVRRSCSRPGQRA